LLGAGEALDPEEIERLKTISEREGVPFDEEKYLEAAHTALSYLPTVSNIERAVEEETGAPLEAKTRLQKGIKLGTSIGRITPGSLAQKGAATISAPAISETAQALGLPESLADILGGASGVIAGAKTPGKLSIEKAKKPSGLTERRYEKLKKPKEVSPKKIKQINEKVENEFRNIASDIIEKSPIEETHSALKNDASFKQVARDAFKDVEKLAEQLPEKFSTVEVGKKLINQAFKKKNTGLTPSEFDQAHQRFVKDFLKKTPKQDITAPKLVEQYRKNNKALTEAYEPGQSFAYNRAKREALLDYNNAIASVIEEKFPDTEFSNLFKSTNKKWSQIMDAEAIDKFMDKLFDGKIQFKTGRQFFDKEGMTVPFKRALGEKGFKDFEQLLKDLMSTEQANKMMKVAESKGFKELADLGISYVVHSKFAIGKAFYKAGKSAVKGLLEAALDKPQLMVKWDKGVKAFKKADFPTAEKEFKSLEDEILDMRAGTRKWERTERPEEKIIEVPGEKVSSKINPNQITGKKQSKLLESPKFTVDYETGQRGYGSKIMNIKNRKGDIVGRIETSNALNGINIEDIYSTHPGAALRGLKELIKNAEAQGKEIYVTPLTEKGAKFASKLLKRKIEPVLVAEEDFSHMMKKSKEFHAKNHKITKEDKKRIMETRG
jgi:hypothetical protein